MRTQDAAKKLVALIEAGTLEETNEIKIQTMELVSSLGGHGPFVTRMSPRMLAIYLCALFISDTNSAA